VGSDKEVRADGPDGRGGGGGGDSDDHGRVESGSVRLLRAQPVVAHRHGVCVHIVLARDVFRDCGDAAVATGRADARIASALGQRTRE